MVWNWLVRLFLGQAGTSTLDSVVVTGVNEIDDVIPQ